MEPRGHGRLQRRVRRVVGHVRQLEGVGVQVVELGLAGHVLDVLPGRAVELALHEGVGRDRPIPVLVTLSSRASS